MDIMEVCPFETFNATCPSDHVIVMTSARYGRMRIGRCVRSDLGYLGCAADVTRILERKCSGRRSCSVEVGDSELRATRPCTTEVTWYLEVAYKCVEVLSERHSTCTVDEPASVGSLGYISGPLGPPSAPGLPLQTGERGASSPQGEGPSPGEEGVTPGGESCPWRLTARPGQRIRITLYHYSADGGSLSSDVCYELGSVWDGVVIGQGGHGGHGGQGSRPLAVCGSDMSRRETPVFVSTTNQMELALKGGPGDLAYLLKYQAIGCGDKVLPSGVWSQRSGDKLVVYCNKSDTTSILVCKGDTWRGHITNCTEKVLQPNWNINDLLEDESVLPIGILIAVAIGVALGIFIGGLLLVLVSAHMKRRQRRRAEREMADAQNQGQFPDVTKAQTLTYTRDYPRDMTLSRQQTMSSGDYASSSLRTDVSSVHDNGDRSALYRHPVVGNHPYESPHFL